MLVACEFSGTVRRAFAGRGHDVWSCDLLPAEDDSPRHVQGDVLALLAQPWDLVIAHPPCTYLTNSGVVWLHRDPSRWAKLDEAAAFFRQLLGWAGPRLAIENPIMHKHARERVGLRQTQCIQPYQFGHAERKATCLWLRGLPLLVPTHDLRAEMLARPKREAQRLHHLPPSKDRWRERSRTFQGIADAMAQQWGSLVA